MTQPQILTPPAAMARANLVLQSIAHIAAIALANGPTTAEINQNLSDRLMRAVENVWRETLPAHFEEAADHGPL